MLAQALSHWLHGGNKKGAGSSYLLGSHNMGGVFFSDYPDSLEERFDPLGLWDYLACYNFGW
jgi:hypothetical protein